MRSRSTAVGLLIGYAVDLIAGDPGRAHPVAWFGARVVRVERAIYADRRGRGAALAGIAVGGASGAGLLLHRLSRSRSPLRASLVSAATWTVLGGTSLARTADLFAAELERGDLDAARRVLPSLCGRDPSGLDGDDLARAGVESVAENTSDAVVAPLFWGALAGLPGLLGYRAVNTLDAMVGHRSPTYARFGAAAARLDDVANLVPARLTGLLAAACAPLVGGSPADALGVAHRDGGKHPSPNAGRCEAAFAGALGVRLGGDSSYDGRVERRGPLGDGRTPTTADLRRAVLLARAVGLLAVGLAAVASALPVSAGRERTT